MKTMNSAQCTNNFLYNSLSRTCFGRKEQQPFTNYYAYGFRQYDAEIGRWHSIDKMAESFTSITPYSYVGGNPISTVDIAGLLPYGGGGWIGGVVGTILRDGTQHDIESLSNSSLFDHGYSDVTGDPDGALVDEWFSSDSYSKGMSFSEYKITKTLLQRSYYIKGYYTSMDGYVFQLNINGNIRQLNGKISVEELKKFLDDWYPSNRTWTFEDGDTPFNIADRLIHKYGEETVFETSIQYSSFLRLYNGCPNIKKIQIGTVWQVPYTSKDFVVLEQKIAEKQAENAYYQNELKKARQEIIYNDQKINYLFIELPINVLGTILMIRYPSMPLTGPAYDFTQQNNKQIY